MHRATPKFPLFAAASLLALLASACDDPKPAGAASSAAAAVSAAPAATTTPVKPKTMPELLVDADGPYLGGSRVDLVSNGGREKLTKLIKDLPIDGKPV